MVSFLYFQIFIKIKFLFFFFDEKNQNQGPRQLWIRGYDLWMNWFVLNLRRFILKVNLCSFAWSKEPKIKATGLLLKRKSRIFSEDSRSVRFILFTPEMLILSVICYAASDKSLAFQFAIKTQQSQGQMDDSELEILIYEWN